MEESDDTGRTGENANRDLGLLSECPVESKC